MSNTVGLKNLSSKPSPPIIPWAARGDPCAEGPGVPHGWRTGCPHRLLLRAKLSFPPDKREAGFMDAAKEYSHMGREGNFSMVNTSHLQKSNGD